ncbi:hypothetical protein ACFWFZ_30745 [Streptomyces sp. NPDC060232]|uniref:hypothetical protein n=1 Tax=Streptomyces sp. NPDC060232 TaxID=3347079 RepID=UPI00364E0BF3
MAQRTASNTTQPATGPRRRARLDHPSRRAELLRGAPEAEATARGVGHRGVGHRGVGHRRIGESFAEHALGPAWTR